MSHNEPNATYSGVVSPEPPIETGKSFSLGQSVISSQKKQDLRSTSSSYSAKISLVLTIAVGKLTCRTAA